MTDTTQLPPLPTLRPGDSHMESLIEAAIQGHASTREAMRWLVRQIVPLQARAQVQGDSSSVTYGCHCDLEPGMKPDGCVLDYGNPNDCVHARGISNREECNEWRPIHITTPQPAQATQAEVTDEQIESEFQQCGGKWNGDQWVIEDADLHPFCRTILALRPVQSGLTGCNCRWASDTQVQWCELHLAHKEAIHEWAERAREAEKQLALRPAAVPMTEDQVWHNDALMSANGTAGFKMDALMRIVRAAEAHHGITAQAKKETP